jgi:3-oxoacyl-[acyl-carrier protein] reductase
MVNLSKNRIALVTGGSRGIGRAISTRLAGDGFCVVVNYHSRENEAWATCEAIDAAGGEAWPCPADVTQRGDVQRLFSAIREKHKSLDVLVNNAGRMHEALFALTPPDQFWQVMQANLMGALLCSQAALRMMVPQRRGVIINMSSTASLRSPIGLSAYAASKAALNSITRTMAREVVSKGIRVNAVAPSWTETEMLKDANQSVIRAGIQHLPLGRLNTPGEIASAVSALVRDDMTGMVGQIVPLDGGGTV